MRISFENCLMDDERRELTVRGQAVPMGPQVFDLLLHLVLNRSRVVSRDELLQVVWTGRVVSDSTIASHINAVRRAIEDSGNEQRLLRTVARKGFRFVGDVHVAGAALFDVEVPVPPRPLVDKPAIAVLPFQNLSGDPGEDYFADGVVEDVITALSRVRWLFVIARNTSFAYKHRLIDPRTVGSELGVRYVLEGSVRRAANSVRITGQLIDASTGTHLWAERFEGTLEDIFELQSRIAESVVGAISPQLERAEIERARRKPTQSQDAYDFYLRGMANLHAGGRDAIDEAQRLFQRAIDLDAEYASAYGAAAWCHMWRKINGWMMDPPVEIAEGIRLARQAVVWGRDDAVALTRGGHALGHLAHDLDGGIALLDRALLLNPNFAPAWFLGGFLRIFHGESEDAMKFLSHVVQLSPLDPEMFRMQAGIALANFFAGNYDDAASWAERALVNLPTLLVGAVIAAASHALAGRDEEAGHFIARVRVLDPNLRQATLPQWLPIHRPQDLARLADGLRVAGLD